MKEYLMSFLLAAWNILRDMAPALLLGYIFAGVITVMIPGGYVRRTLGGKGFGVIVRAALLGVPLPLCSCSVIPVSAVLKKQGAGKGAIASFLISTPQTGIDSFLVTYSMLGPVFAFFRPLAAFISGIFGGFLVKYADQDETDQEPDSADQCPKCSSCPGIESWEEERGNVLVRILKHALVTIPADISSALMTGILIAGLISMFIPEQWFHALAGGGVFPIFVMMFIGVPMYVCATASVPIGAVLLAKGISPGAVFVFLMVGPATNAAGIVAVAKIIGRRSTFFYLLSVIISALVFGMVFDYLNISSSVSAGTGQHCAEYSWRENLCALIVLMITLFAFYRNHLRRKKEGGKLS